MSEPMIIALLASSTSIIVALVGFAAVLYQTNRTNKMKKLTSSNEKLKKEVMARIYLENIASDEIAEELGTTPMTAKLQMRNILEGTHNLRPQLSKSDVLSM